MPRNSKIAINNEDINLFKCSVYIIFNKLLGNTSMDNRQNIFSGTNSFKSIIREAIETDLPAKVQFSYTPSDAYTHCT